jgi:nucleoid DNA-binding protein
MLIFAPVLMIQSTGMHTIIAPSFFQKKYIVLPGIGKLSLVTKPAETDFLNKQLIAPQQQIVYTPEVKDDSIFNEFSAISDLVKRRLNENGVVTLQGIGTFNVEPGGAINFTAQALQQGLQQPVAAIRVIRENTSHTMRVGDMETTNTEMTALLGDTTVSADRWWIWALVLGAAGLLALALYAYQQGGLFSFGSLLAN